VALPAKLTTTLRRGDTIRHEQPGGGGHGDPLERDPALVAADVANEKVSAAYARREHGVVLDAALKVDAEETRALRARLRAGVPVAPRDCSDGKA
jgi:N-methylhydantoinase B